jgi:ABC-2 type transport system permease protein
MARPMLRSVLTKTLWDQRRSIVMWALAVAAVGVLYASFYPSMTSPEMEAAMEAFPPGLLDALGMTDITSPAGYVGSTTYGLLGPVLMIIFAASIGTRAIAGEEEDGRLDLLLAHPVRRLSVVIQRGAAMAIALVLAGAVLLVAMIAVSGPAGFADLGAGNLAAASAQLVLLALVFGSIALTGGAVTGSPALANAVVAVAAVGTYLANTLGPTVDALAWTQKASPFFYYSGGRPLVNGFQPGDAVVLVIIAVVLSGIAALGFSRRDVAV